MIICVSAHQKQQKNWKGYLGQPWHPLDVMHGRTFFDSIVRRTVHIALW